MFWLSPVIHGQFFRLLDSQSNCRPGMLRVQRDLEQGRFSWSENPLDLRDCLLVVINVLKHVGTDDAIKGAIRKTLECRLVSSVHGSRAYPTSGFSSTTYGILVISPCTSACGISLSNRVTETRGKRERASPTGSGAICRIFRFLSASSGGRQNPKASGFSPM